MKVLYITYWGLSEGLTSSTVIPHLKILASFDHIAAIDLCTIERVVAEQPVSYAIPKLTHHPLHSTNMRPGILNKMLDFIRLPRMIARVVQERHPDRIICRGAMAGALGYLAHRKTGVPFHVESFEPHARYMLESGVWSSFDPRYLLQKIWEKRQKKYAASLQPVAHNYRNQLIAEGLDPERVKVIPCCTDLDYFKFDPERRDSTRAALGFDNTITGIYVGKFGGIYYDREAFSVFKQAFDHFGPTFRLIILTPEPKTLVEQKLAQAGIPGEQAWVNLVPHTEVPHYLSAADFAFSTIKPSASRIYCSPVKNGEYWANGLPILSTDGVGDDSEQIRRDRGGAVFDLQSSGDLQKAFEAIQSILHQPDHRQRMADLANKYRSFDIARACYAAVHRLP
ncbi:MAG: glycosyltransferase [Bacteroidota bacterium]